MNYLKLKFNNKQKKITFYVVISIILIIAFFISIYLGQVKITPKTLIDVLLGKGSSGDTLIIYEFRLPRIIVSLLVGIGMATAGCALQGLLRNDLADPSILGINSGASFFVLIYLSIFSASSQLSIIIMPVLALIGGLLAAVLIYILSFKKGEYPSPQRLLLTGVAINTGFQAATLFLTLTLNRKQFAFAQLWSAGSIFGDEWRYIGVLLPWVLIFYILIYYFSKYLNVLSLGNIIATGLGVSVNKRFVLLSIFAVSLAAGCVAIGGSIAFIGMIAPHIAKKFVGPNFKVLLPASALMGGMILILADTLGRIILPNTEIPTGIVVSIIGAPYFLYLMMKSV